MMCYSRTYGYYVELCEINEDAAAFCAYGGHADDWSVIRLLDDDIRHTHTMMGKCIPVRIMEHAIAARDARVRMARAFVAGFNFVRA